MRDWGPFTETVLLATQSHLHQDTSSSRPTCELWFLPFPPHEENLLLAPLSSECPPPSAQPDVTSMPTHRYEVMDISLLQSTPSHPRVGKKALESQEKERRGWQGIWGAQLQIPEVKSILPGLCYIPCKPPCPAKRSSLQLAMRAQSQHTPKIRASPVTSHPSLGR